MTVIVNGGTLGNGGKEERPQATKVHKERLRRMDLRRIHSQSLKLLGAYLVSLDVKLAMGQMTSEEAEFVKHVVTDSADAITKAGAVGVNLGRAPKGQGTDSG